MVEIVEYPWTRMAFDGEAHYHAYVGGSSEKHTTSIGQMGDGVTVGSCINDRLILKTTDSGVEEYIKDQYTTLKETADRIFTTQCEATARA